MSTLIRAPASDPSMSPMENTLALTALSNVAPVCMTLPLKHVQMTYNPPGFVHQYKAALASTWSSRCLRRSSYCAMFERRSKDRSSRFYYPLHALLLCIGRQLRDSDHVQRRESSRRAKFRDQNSSSEATREAHFHCYAQLHERTSGKRESSFTRSIHAKSTGSLDRKRFR